MKSLPAPWPVSGGTGGPLWGRRPSGCFRGRCAGWAGPRVAACSLSPAFLPAGVISSNWTSRGSLASLPGGQGLRRLGGGRRAAARSPAPPPLTGGCPPRPPAPSAERPDMLDLPGPEPAARPPLQVPAVSRGERSGGRTLPVPFWLPRGPLEEGASPPSPCPCPALSPLPLVPQGGAPAVPGAVAAAVGGHAVRNLGRREGTLAPRRAAAAPNPTLNRIWRGLAVFLRPPSRAQQPRRKLASPSPPAPRRTGRRRTASSATRRCPTGNPR